MKLFGFLLVVAATANAFNYTSFINDDILYPKCCPYGEHLVRLNDTNFICEGIERVLYDIRAADVLNYTYEGNATCPEEDCVDFYISGTQKELIVPTCNTTGVYEKYIQYIEYPKCCPVGHAYDPVIHGCTKTKTNKFESVLGLLVFNISLSQCIYPRAIIDYSDLNGTVLDENQMITMNNGRKYKFGSYCLDENARTGADILRACEDYNYACKTSFDDTGVRCIRKCCPDGHSFSGKRCMPTFKYGINLTHENRFPNSTDSNIGVLAAPVGKKYLSTSEHLFFIDNIGNMHSKEERNLRVRTSLDAKYCVDSVSGTQKFFLFFAGKTAIENIKFTLEAVMLSISCLFLLLTFLIYLVLPEMHNLFGKSIMMYCVISFVGYLVLAYTQVFGLTLMSACVPIGFIIMYAFLSSFSWLNIICFDMWMAFGQMRVMNLRDKYKDNKRFLLYSLYGWGLPTVITLSAVATYKYRFLPESLIPHIGKLKCYFEKSNDTYDHILFFVGPVTIMLIFNSILFTKTILYCFKVKDEINRMKDTTGEKDKRNKKFNTDKEKLIMLLKLFLIMGISWLFEVLSSVYSFKNSDFSSIVEVIWDVFNCLQGLFIFLIFIFKKKVLMSLQRKLFPKLKNRRASEQSSTTLSTSLYTYAKARDPGNRRISDVKANYV